MGLAALDPPYFPRHTASSRPCAVIGRPGQAEQEVGQPIEVGKELARFGRPAFAHDRDQSSLRPAADRSGDVQGRRGRHALRQDEVPQRRQFLVAAVDRPLQKRDVLGRDRRGRRLLGATTDRLGARGEQIVLDLREKSVDIVRALAPADHSKR